MKNQKELELLGTDWHNSGHAISADTLKNLSADTLNNLSADTLKNLSAYTLNNLSADTLNNLSADTLNNLSADTLKNLSAYTLKNLSAYTLNNLSADTLNNLSAYTLKNLSADTLTKIKEMIKLATWEKPYTHLLAAIKAPGCSLDMSNWHSCDTTHCIAGWTTAKAPGGKELERRFGTEAAARMILKVSRPGAPLPRFDAYAPEDAIMAFVEARAEEERK